MKEIQKQADTAEKIHLELFFPKAEDCWQEAKLLRDPETMSCSAGYDGMSEGYDYTTGCIDCPKEEWQAVFENRQKKGAFFADLYDPVLDRFVGSVNYQKNPASGNDECGMIIEGRYRNRGYGLVGLKLLCAYAKANGIQALYDNFEADRQGVLKLFEKAGFWVCQKTEWKKFGRETDGVIVKIEFKNENRQI